MRKKIKKKNIKILYFKMVVMEGKFNFHDFKILKKFF